MVWRLRARILWAPALSSVVVAGCDPKPSPPPTQHSQACLYVNMTIYDECLPHTEIAPWQFVAHDCGVEIVSIDGPADLVPSGDTAEPTNGICCYPVTQLVHEVCAYR